MLVRQSRVEGPLNEKSALNLINLEVGKAGLPPLFDSKAKRFFKFDQELY